MENYLTTHQMIPIDGSTISRPALGHVAALGDLYDARTDNFSGMSIFKHEIPQSAISMVDNPGTDIHLLKSDTYSEKFKKLEVDPGLQVSVLLKLLKLGGSAKFLDSHKNSAKTIRSSLFYHIKTKTETLNMFHQDLAEAFALETIKLGVATHVVYKISWGANCVLSCESSNTDNPDVKEIEGKLSAHLELIQRSISAKSSIEFSSANTNNNFTLHLYGDILPGNDDLPTTFEEALSLLKRMPSLVANSNNGRGNPLVFHLIPVSVLKGYLSLSFVTDDLSQSLEEDVLLGIVQLFDSLSKVHQELHDFYSDASDYKVCIRPEDIAKFSNLKEKFDLRETKLRSDLASALTNVRSKKAGLEELENVIATFQLGEFSSDKVMAQLSSWSYVSEKIKFAKTLIGKGATYVGFGSSLEAEILNDSESTAYLLYFKEAEKTSEWNENWQFFSQQMNKKIENERYFLIDCDAHPNLWPDDGLSIQVLKGGKVISQNLLKDHRDAASIPVAKCTIEMTRSTAKPNNRTFLEITCPGTNCTLTNTYRWVCPKCRYDIEYGFDGHFYCSCGNGLSGTYEFKCPDPNHGLGYEKHDVDHLKKLLSRLKLFKELNILILGETGVGKSTWINGFQNYLRFESLQEAEVNELSTLIPSTFTMCDEDYKEITITTGEDQNEVQGSGQSATQSSKVYSFVVDDTQIRLIDTPGVGDTRGIEHDKKNFENILSTLSYLEELHGICILLKPNNARLGVMFQFCIKELLTYLHRDASKNIVFCFTNSRSTFYRPGDTMPVLRNLLKANSQVNIPISNHTVYCFDSEAYRFLAAIKNGSVKFPNEERDNFAKSWEKSIQETKRLLEHISELEPHPIKSTINLNKAREIVLQLTRPLAEISKNIQTTKRIEQETLKELQQTRATVEELEKKKFFHKLELETVRIDHPKTVCTNVNCKRIYGQGDIMRIDYFTVCHSPCELEDVNNDVIGDEKLLNCECISSENQNCVHSNCGHSYREHMHINYETRQVLKQVEDASVAELLRSKLSEEEVKQKMIDMSNQRIFEYEYELNEIKRASVKFACFLKQNAITPYNDAMIAYMKHLIREEESKVEQGGNAKTLESLKVDLAAYEEQIRILDQEMEKAENHNIILTPTDVGDLVRRLCRLKHFGSNLGAALNASNTTDHQTGIYNEVFAASPVKRGFIRSTMNYVKTNVSDLASNSSY